MATSYSSESVELDRISAIESARLMRCEMSQTLSEISQGAQTLRDVLVKNAESASSRHLYVVKVLESIQKIGKVKARRLMADLEITEKRRVESLSAVERQELLQKLEAFI